MRCVLRTLGVVALLSTLLDGATPQIKPAELLDHIKFLASDDMKGRANGSPELERAADYIAQQFKAAGLQPGGTNGDWFQPFELIAGLTVGKGNELDVNYNGRKVSLTLGRSYYPLAAT